MLHSRRTLLRRAGHSVVALLALPALLVAPTFATAAGGIPRGPVLEQRLLMGLRAKTDGDREFIARVVELVEEGKLPVKLVDASYFFARKKAADRGRQWNNAMVYFRPAMRARARAIGVTI